MDIIIEVIIGCVNIIIGTMYIYFCGMKPALNKMREKCKMISLDGSYNDIRSSKSFPKKKVISMLVLFSFVIAFVFLALLQISGYNKPDNVWYSVISMAYYIVLLTPFVVSNVNVDNVSIENASKNIFLTIFGEIKMILLNIAITLEKNWIIAYNRELIREIYKAKKTPDGKNKMGALVARINRETFKDSIYHYLDNTMVEDFNIQVLDIAIVYFENSTDIHKKVRDFFSTSLIKLNVPICEITDYLNDFNDTYDKEEAENSIRDMKKQVEKYKRELKAKRKVSQRKVNNLDEFLNQKRGSDYYVGKSNINSSKGTSGPG